MEVKNNFANIICLGNFNPSILTPNFITEVCKLKIDGKAQGQTTPVVSSLQWGNISFIVEMDRMQVRESNIGEFQDTKVIQCLESYLGVLRYTPIFACGLNLNSSIKEFDITNVNNNLQNKDRMLSILKTGNLTIEKKEIAKPESQEWQSYNFIYPSENNTVFHLNLRKNQESIIINFNFEVRAIENDLTRVKNIGNQLANMVALYKKIVEDIVTGV